MRVKSEYYMATVPKGSGSVAVVSHTNGCCKVFAVSWCSWRRSTAHKEISVLSVTCKLGKIKGWEQPLEFSVEWWRDVNFRWV